MARKAKTCELYFPAALSAAGGSLRWPKKPQPGQSVKPQIDYESEIAALIKLELLWRPSIAIRPLDLFNNLALAGFFVSHELECRRLVEADLIRLCSWVVGDFRTMLEEWAFGRGPEQPMHWCHLTPERQKEYDEACRKRRLKESPNLENYLHLSEHSLDIDRLVELFDRIFPSNKIVTVSFEHETQTNLFSRRVEREWSRYLSQRRQNGPPPTAVTTIVEKTLEDCSKDYARMRLYYTALEELLDYPNLRRDFVLSDLLAEINATKCFVLNEVYFNEYKEMRGLLPASAASTKRIVVNRDVSRVWLPEERHPLQSADDYMKQSDSILSEAFVPLEFISFEEIVEMHCSSREECLAFQSSMQALEELESGFPAVNVSQNKINEVVATHLKHLKTCIQLGLKRRNLQDWTEAFVAEVFTGFHPAKVSALVAAPASFSVAHAIANSATAQGYIGLIISGLFIFRLYSKSSTYQWKQFEASLSKHITDQLSDSLPESN